MAKNKYLVNFKEFGSIEEAQVLAQVTNRQVFVKLGEEYYKVQSSGTVIEMTDLVKKAIEYAAKQAQPGLFAESLSEGHKGKRS